MARVMSAGFLYKRGKIPFAKEKNRAAWLVECPFFEKFIEFIEKYFYRIFRKKGLRFFDK
jgi:hypothetical protein